ncbi:MAG TPA: hypothetical protein VLK33_15220 [Terriglobales bacterium]|nr:hypothetical protein [Terriglobales bacterium]
MTKVLLAGILGGVALFMWGGLSHMALGLGSVGIENIQRPVYDSIKTSIPHAGFYFFPENDMKGNMKDEYKNGPTGILIYKPTGAGAPMTGQMINETILNIVQALIAAFLLSFATKLTRYPQRVGFVFTLGILSAIATNIEYWNWYGFPSSYTMASIFDKLIGFMVVGLVVAAFVKPAAMPIPMRIDKAA